MFGCLPWCERKTRKVNIRERGDFIVKPGDVHGLPVHVLFTKCATNALANSTEQVRQEPDAFVRMPLFAMIRSLTLR